MKPIELMNSFSMEKDMQRFRDRLVKQLHNFNLKEALELCDEIHEFECSGGEISAYEDSLWYNLTVKIESERK